ncbi:hypothetical protein SAMN05444380_11571 [Thermophagus xiamenensis]|uniref:Uncharacterized protein n=1 Tax=Thermophagus xiamenensis TaxID=385682 RepID=A0A1I2C9W5_9BACT|nr:hypothetical protein SAMN05444380_11571 [Thermophagus xiamenensis]
MRFNRTIVELKYGMGSILVDPGSRLQSNHSGIEI